MLLPERNNTPVILWRLRFAAQAEDFHKHVKRKKKGSFSSLSTVTLQGEGAAVTVGLDSRTRCRRGAVNCGSSRKRTVDEPKEPDSEVIGCRGGRVQQWGQLSKLENPV